MNFSKNNSGRDKNNSGTTGSWPKSHPSVSHADSKWLPATGCFTSYPNV